MSIITIRDAIRVGASEIACNNRTYIHICKQECPPKIIDGKPVYRTINCRIIPPYSAKNKCHMRLDDLPGMSDLKAKGCWIGGYDGYFDFIIKERDLNHFISMNGGIDEYATWYWIDVYNDLYNEIGGDDYV